MNTRDQLIIKQKEYIELLKKEISLELRKGWQEQCQQKEHEINSLEQKLQEKQSKKTPKLTKQEEWKQMADKIRSLKKDDWGLSF